MDNIGFDKFHEECGVVAIHGHPEAAKLALGLEDIIPVARIRR